MNNGQPVPFSDMVKAVETEADVTQCFTNCSGFIMSLFAYVNKIKGTPTKFDSWEAGKVVPEAGCFGLTVYPNSSQMKGDNDTWDVIVQLLEENPTSMTKTSAA